MLLTFGKFNNLDNSLELKIQAYVSRNVYACNHYVYVRDKAAWFRSRDVMTILKSLISKNGLHRTDSSHNDIQ